jgi:ParB-like chromosome segregation protein Spo0J
LAARRGGAARLPYSSLQESFILKDIQMKPKQWLKAPRHSRRRLDDSKLRHLADNIEAIGLLNPIECLPCGEIISGYHRLLAVMLSDRITEVPVRIVADPLDAKQLRVRRVSENLQRSDLTFFQKYEECQGFREDEPGIAAKEIAELLSVDPSTITRYLCLNDCIEEVREAARANLIIMKACYEISQATPERQKKLLAMALKRSAKDVAEERKRSHSDAEIGQSGTDSAKTSSLKIVLDDGTTVTVRGKELTVERILDALSKASKEGKQAKERKLTAKTWRTAIREKVESDQPEPAKAGV